MAQPQQAQIPDAYAQYLHKALRGQEATPPASPYLHGPMPPENRVFPQHYAVPGQGPHPLEPLLRALREMMDKNFQAPPKQ